MQEHRHYAVLRLRYYFRIRPSLSGSADGTATIYGRQGILRVLGNLVYYSTNNHER
jgi:hypothetical protein